MVCFFFAVFAFVEIGFQVLFDTRRAFFKKLFLGRFYCFVCECSSLFCVFEIYVRVLSVFFVFELFFYVFEVDCRVLLVKFQAFWARFEVDVLGISTPSPVGL